MPPVCLGFLYSGSSHVSSRVNNNLGWDKEPILLEARAKGLSKSSEKSHGGCCSL